MAPSIACWYAELLSGYGSGDTLFLRDFNHGGCFVGFEMRALLSTALFFSPWMLVSPGVLGTWWTLWTCCCCRHQSGAEGPNVTDIITLS